MGNLPLSKSTVVAAGECIENMNKNITSLNYSPVDTRDPCFLKGTTSWGCYTRETEVKIQPACTSRRWWYFSMEADRLPSLSGFCDVKSWRAGGWEGAGKGLFPLGGRKVDCAAGLASPHSWSHHTKYSQVPLPSEVRERRSWCRCLRKGPLS